MKDLSEVVQATVADLPRVVPLFDAYRVWYGESSDLAAAQNFLFDRFEHSEAILFLAVSSDGSGLGFAQIYPLFSSLSMRRLWLLNDLFVDEGHRGKGLGRQLLQASRDFAAATRSKGLFLETQRTNNHAQRLYENFGFVRDHEFFAYHLNL